eukprot:gene5047-biopygen8593
MIRVGAGTRAQRAHGCRKRGFRESYDSIPRNPMAGNKATHTPCVWCAKKRVQLLGVIVDVATNDWPRWQKERVPVISIEPNRKTGHCTRRTYVRTASRRHSRGARSACRWCARSGPVSPAGALGPGLSVERPVASRAPTGGADVTEHPAQGVESGSWRYGRDRTCTVSSRGGEGAARWGASLEHVVAPDGRSPTVEGR